MIKNERQRRAALNQIAYWKTVTSAGGQSWLAGEQALGEIMTLHKQIAEYERESLPKHVILP
jgi:hypothetical protein